MAKKQSANTLRVHGFVKEIPLTDGTKFQLPKIPGYSHDSDLQKLMHGLREYISEAVQKKMQSAAAVLTGPC